MHTAAPCLLLALLGTVGTAELLHAPLVRIDRVLTRRELLASLIRTHARYGSTEPLERRQSELGIGFTEGVDATTKAPSASYYISLGFGGPVQNVNVLLDTASSDIVVAGATCTDNCHTTAAPYDSGKSVSAGNLTNQITINELHGQVVGSSMTDTITLGSTAIRDAPFLYVWQAPVGMFDNTTPGVLGLGGSGLSVITANANPVWVTAFRIGNLTDQMFSFWLGRTTSQGGTFTFGGTKALLFTGSIDYMDVATTDNMYWNLNVTQITAQGNAISVTAATHLASFDTASTLILGPKTDVATIWAQVPGAVNTGVLGLYQFPCDTKVQITVSFGGQRTWSIDPADINLGPSFGTTSQCLGAIGELADSTAAAIPPKWVLGTTFLKNVYSVFRQSPRSVGFAELSDLAKGLAPTSSGSSTATSSPASTSPTSSPTSSNTTTPTPTPKKLNAGAIAGGVIGGLVAIGLAIAAFIFWRRRRRFVDSDVQSALPPLEPYIVEQFEKRNATTGAGMNASALSPSTSPTSHASPLPSPPAGAGASLLFDMKRAQSDAIARHDANLHRGAAGSSAPAEGQQVELPSSPLPGAGPSTAPASSSPSNDATPGPVPRTTLLQQQVHDLQAEVQRLQLAAEDGNAVPPPSYAEI